MKIARPHYGRIKTEARRTICQGIVYSVMYQRTICRWYITGTIVTGQLQQDKKEGREIVAGRGSVGGRSVLGDGLSRWTNGGIVKFLQFSGSTSGTTGTTARGERRRYREGDRGLVTSVAQMPQLQRNPSPSIPPTRHGGGFSD